uniref:Cytochrome P450 4c3 n=1 Tax=Lygus hesperus TaxID=30085 RepID=A0A0A9WEL4_LYGHE
MGVISSAVISVAKIGTLPFLAILVISLLLFRYWKMRRMIRLMDKIPGLPGGLPFLGNAVELNVDHDEVFTRIASTRMLWGRKHGLCKVWFGSRPILCISKASAVEVILSSSKLIDKSDEYNYLHPWLGRGLLTSSGHQWHSRRRILTPSFHFKILDHFVTIFVEQSLILKDRLSSHVDEDAFNIFPFITRCTLDIICETAMGRKVNAQTRYDSEYVRAVYKIGSIVQNRQSKIWLQPEWAFKLSNLYEEHQECLRILHGFSTSVIQERRKELSNQTDHHPKGNGSLAFLDLLLEASNDGKCLTDQDIREEVDTFMFEGHDTTSAALCWTLFLLGSHPEIQDQAYQELRNIFGDDDRPPNSKDLASMKYLTCCIKEALRLYPSVPIFARKLNEDVTIAEYTVPAGTTALIIAYQLHRDPEQFPNPEMFEPERFMERDPTLHPYAYIPFSAGPRNCIGQKFALLEEKVVLSTILREYKVLSVDRREDLVLLGELILRPKNELKMKLQLRK